MNAERRAPDAAAVSLMVLLLGEPLTPSFAAAAMMVGGGIFLVNLKR